MRIDEKNLRAHLRSEAARVPVPEGMWAKLADQMSAEQAPRRRSASFREMITPALGICAAVAVFWVSLVPALDQSIPSETVRVRTGRPALAGSYGPTASDMVQPTRFEFPPDNRTKVASGPVMGSEVGRMGAVIQ